MTSDKSLPITKPTLVRSRSGDDLPIGSMANSTQIRQARSDRSTGEQLEGTHSLPRPVAPAAA